MNKIKRKKPKRFKTKKELKKHLDDLVKEGYLQESYLSYHDDFLNGRAMAIYVADYTRLEGFY